MAKLNVSELEFDEIKKNLKEFLSAQDELKDYNFEGSALSILMDVLAYTTHYNSLYDNLIVNESFLDSATKRNSVVSRAGEIGYIPKSATCSKTTVDVTFDEASSSNPLPSTIQIPILSPFTASSPSGTFLFYNLDSVTLRKQSDNKYIAEDITLYAGKPLKLAVKVDNIQQRFIIPNGNVDRNLIKVRVFDNTATSTFHTFKQVENFVTVDGDTRAYWIKELDDGVLELKFGDGVLGKALAVGNLVVIEYLISYGIASNGVAENKKLVYTGSTTLDHSTGSVTFGKTEVITTISSFNGSDIETIDSIKFNAPRAFSTQNRAVTAEDFKHIVLTNFSDAASVSVWGGEDNIPPVYGKVFIAVSQHTNKPLSLAQKAEIRDILSTKKALTIIPEIVDAEYLNLDIDVTVYYDPLNSTLTDSSIANIVKTTIDNYNESNLKTFDKVFRESRLLRDIDNSNQSIVNSSLSLFMRVELDPKYNVISEYRVNMINPITAGSVVSSGFYVDGFENQMFLEDNSGKVQMYYYDDTSTKVIVVDDVGTVNYDSGLINLYGLDIVALVSGTYTLSLKMIPQHKNVVSALTKIVKISGVNIEVIADKTAAGNLRAGLNFQF